MTPETFVVWLHEYGGFAIWAIVLMEYMNLPGFPAGVVMPLAGMWAFQGNISFSHVMVITVLAGLLGSWILYFLGFFLGAPLLDKLKHKFPKQRPTIDRALSYVRANGSWGLFIGKLIPMFRTLIPIPAGVIRMNFMRYTVVSLLGVFVWNLALVGAGYFFGRTVLPALAGVL